MASRATKSRNGPTVTPKGSPRLPTKGYQGKSGMETGDYDVDRTRSSKQGSKTQGEMAKRKAAAAYSRSITTPVLFTGRTQLTRAFFSTSPCHQKGPIQATKDTLKAADRLVSDAAVKGIEKGEAATNRIKHTIGSASKQAERGAEDAAKKTTRKASDVADEAAEKEQEFSGKA
ncbi:hypothetical protein MaudCBS49596_004523 [Microsporum audouinii]